MRNRHILIIDDDEEFVTLLTKRLERLGYAVSAATGGDKGIDIARTERPDAIILDLYMPGIDGYEVSKLLDADEKTRDIPIVVLTSAEAERFRKKSLDWGADAFVTKRMLEFGSYLRAETAGEDVPVGRKDEFDPTVLQQVLEKVLGGATRRS